MLAALWLSLAAHGAVITVFQVRPPAARGSELLIDARLETPAMPDMAEVAEELAEAVTKVESPVQPRLESDTGDSENTPGDPPQEVPDALEPQTREIAQAPMRIAEAPPAPQLAAPPAAPASPATTLPTLDVPFAPDPTYYSAREVDVHPAPVYPIVHKYPEQARRESKQGRVTVLLHIETDGRVSAAEVATAEQPGVFDDAALEPFLKPWFRFYPAKKNGRAVRALMKVDVRFYDPVAAP
jgi:protein TonB